MAGFAVRRALSRAWEAVDAVLLWLAFEPAGRWVGWREGRKRARREQPEAER